MTMMTNPKMMLMTMQMMMMNQSLWPHSAPSRGRSRQPPSHQQPIIINIININNINNIVVNINNNNQPNIETTQHPYIKLRGGGGNGVKRGENSTYRLSLFSALHPPDRLYLIGAQCGQQAARTQ